MVDSEQEIDYRDCRYTGTNKDPDTWVFRFRTFNLTLWILTYFFALEYQGGGLFCPSKFGTLSIEIQHCVFVTIYSNCNL